MKPFVAWLPAILIAVVIFLLSSIPGSGLPGLFPGADKIAHGGIYAALAAGCAFALRSSHPSLQRCWWLVAAGLASLYGVTDELHQLLVPGRSCDVWDWVADTGGAFGGVGGFFWWWRARERSRAG